MNRHFYYLPVERDDVRWGLYVKDYGFAEVKPGDAYPSGGHPEPYLFSWERGRRLAEYQLVYITRGRGLFESEATGPVHVEAGCVLLLFPGVWHRYRPVRAVGWDEHWIGYGGEYADRVMREFFEPGEAVRRVGVDAELVRLMLSVGELMPEGPAGYQQVMAARALEALARVRSLALDEHPANRDASRKVHEARCYILDHADSDIHLQTLARDLGMSYSRFRASFRRITGRSPRQYQLDIRMNKACALLRDTTLSASEISERLGFSSLYYFSRLFKKRFGQSPSVWRVPPPARGSALG